MTEQLYLRLGIEPDRAEAVVLTADGRQARAPARVSMANAASLSEGRRVCVLVPGDRAVVLTARIPATSASRVRSLLPYSLEDQFATEIDELHFAAGATLPDGRILATVVEKAQVEEWLAGLASAGIKPQAIYADCDGVPDTPSTLSLIVEGDIVLGRRPGEAPFTLDALGLDEVWSLLGTDEPDSGDLQHVMVYGTGADLERRRQELEALRELVADLDIREVRESATALLASRLVSVHGTNLLQGEYAPRSNVRAALKPWRAAASVALGLIAASVAGTGIEVLRLGRADAALTEQTASLCAERFGVSLASACRAEVQRRLADAGQSATSGQESFLSALGVVAGTGGPDSIEALSYRNRTLDLDMQVADVAALDSFAQAVAGSMRFEVRTLSNTPEDDGLRSRVQVIEAQ